MKNDLEKDEFIKDKLKDDVVMSRKAEDLFKNIKNMEVNMKEENEKVKKRGFTIAQKIASVAACAVIVFGGANIYATTQGYDNIFFMIKDKVSDSKETSNKDEILLDRDITISYKKIPVFENLDVMIRNIQIKDGVAKLLVVVNERGEIDSTVFPLKYKIYNDSGKLLGSKDSSKDSQEQTTYTEEIVIENYNNENILKLEIYKLNDEKITTITINLNEKTIEVQGEEESLKKISEIELKKFLGYEAIIEQIYSENCKDINGTKILAAHELLKESYKKEGITERVYTRLVKAEDVKKVVKEVFKEEVGTTLGDMYWLGNNGGTGLWSGEDCYTKNAKCEYKSNPNGTCLDISNISYCNGVYKVTFSYVYIPENADYDINDLDIYENTVSFKYDENNEYSKFLITSREKPIVLKSADKKEEGAVEGEKVTIDNLNPNTDTNTDPSTNTNPNTDPSTNTNPNTDPNNSSSSSEENNKPTDTSNINNYASTMSWTDYWAPGIKIKYPTEFKLEEKMSTVDLSGEEKITTTITGVATGVNTNTKEIINSNVTINIYQPRIIDETEANEYLNYWIKHEAGWFEDYGVDIKTGVNVVSYVHVSKNDERNGEISYSILKVEYLIDNYMKGDILNIKAKNIIDWMIGTAELTGW